jgi:hypothetical protein
MAGGASRRGDLPLETVIWRRIPPRHFPKKPGQNRPNSPAFDDDDEDEPMSVVIAREGRDPSEVLAGHEGFGLVELTIEELEAAGQEVIRDPRPEEPDHALVIGAKTLATKRCLAKTCRWVVRPFPGTSVE